MQWFQEHSEFNSNLFYIVGDSYGGMFGPMVATYILNGKFYFYFLNFFSIFIDF